MISKVGVSAFENMRILGIETSCDETAAAVIETGDGDKKVELVSNVVASSLYLHSKTGGIIPEIAAREQVKYIITVITKALKDSNLYPPSSKNHLLSSTIYRPNIDAIAVTVGPGLIGSLLVGVETARTLSYVWQKPIIPVNHLVGHIYANFIGTKISPNLSLRAKRSEARQSQMLGIASSQAKPDPRNDTITFPALSLIVSGGHTDLVLLKSHSSIKWLGGTRDDAAGEAFDKIGRLLGLPYPGGPAIEKAAKNGNPKAFQFPRPMLHNNNFYGEARPGSAWEFSFSGLKTAVLRETQGVHTYSSSDQAKPESREVSSDKFSTSSNNKIIADISASAQQAITDVLIAKTLKAAQKYKVKSILLGGGVATNQKLRDQFALEIRNLKLEIALSVPPKYLCTDNAAMIASAAFFNYKPVPWQKLTANPELYFD